MKFHPKRTRIKRVRPISNARRSFLFTKVEPQPAVETSKPVEETAEVLAVGQPEPQTEETVVLEEPIQEEVTAVADDTAKEAEPTEDTTTKPRKGRAKKTKVADESTELPEADNEYKQIKH
ncbi:MAG: hypothetical protein LUD72_04755 [Bacteroidales bacterium]|nr:hypothetical protein [Bacteroidales bacterium]